VSDLQADQFRKAASERGLLIPDDMDCGKFKRCPILGRAKGNQDGAYVYFADSFPAGGFQNWADGEGWQDWRADLDRPLSSHEEKTYQERIQAARAMRDAEEARAQAAAAEKAAAEWEQAAPCEFHPYLSEKGVKPHGLRVIGDKLVMPFYTPSGILSTHQTITATGAKRWLFEGRKQGCFYMIGKVGTGPLCIAEGFATAASIHEATGFPVAVAGDAGNLQPVAKALRTVHPEADLVICADDDPTKGNPGKTAAIKAAQVVPGCRVVLPVWPNDRPEKDKDFNDLAKTHGLDAVKVCFEAPSLPVEPESVFDAVKRFAKMQRLEYEQIRTSEAKRLGIRASELDKAVDTERQAGRETAGKAAMFPTVEPWPDPVDAAELLTEIRSTIQRFIVCSKDTAIATALWIAFTWFVDHLQVAPLLVVTAPEKRCGKSQLLDVTGRMSRRPLVASNISPAAVYRVIEAHSPTLLIDEADSFLKENEELRGVINSGHTRQSAYVIRTVGDDHVPTQFSTWGAKAISGIGHLSGTLMDRAIVATLRRKLPSESCQRLRHASPEVFKRLASKLARFAEDHSYTIGDARPSLPEELNDRAQDNWEPLLAIADHAGGEWPKMARAAALNLSGVEHDPVSTSTELLADIQAIFAAKKEDRIWSVDLIAALVADDSKAWASYEYGKPISARQLAERLGEFGITSKDIKKEQGDKVFVRKGYDKDAFKDVFDRYLSATPKMPLPATA